MGDRSFGRCAGAFPAALSMRVRAPTLKQAFETYVYAKTLSSAQTDHPVTPASARQSAARQGFLKNK